MNSLIDLQGRSTCDSRLKDECAEGVCRGCREVRAVLGLGSRNPVRNGPPQPLSMVATTRPSGRLLPSTSIAGGVFLEGYGRLL